MTPNLTANIHLQGEKICGVVEANQPRAPPLISLREMGVEEVRSQKSKRRRSIESNGLANTTGTEFALQAV